MQLIGEGIPLGPLPTGDGLCPSNPGLAPQGATAGLFESFPENTLVLGFFL